jgi:hypothetical protein
MEELTPEQEAEIRQAAYNGEEPSPEESAGAPVGKEDTQDPWSGLPPALKETIDGMSNRLAVLDTIEERLKQSERRVGSLQNEIYNAKKAAEEVKQAPTKQEMEAAQKSTAAWESLKEDFPEWAEAIDARFAEQSKQFKQDTPDFEKINQEIAELKSLREKAVTNDNLEVRLLGMMHPDWQEVVKDPAYKSWVEKQPDPVKQRAYHGKTAEEAVSVLNLFKSSRKPNNSKSRLDQAVEIPSGPKQSHIRSDLDMSDLEYRKKLQKELWG